MEKMIGILLLGFFLALLLFLFEPLVSDTIKSITVTAPCGSTCRSRSPEKCTGGWRAP